MKQVMTAAAVAVALLLAGCGKSDAQRALETGLNDEITKMHDAGMGLYNQAKDLTGQIDAAIASHDSLANKYAKKFTGHSADDLRAAKDKVTAAMASMDAWMKDFKPYDPEVPHEQVLVSLNKTKDDVMKVKADLEGAIGGAMASMDAHKAFVEQALKGVAKK